MTMARWKVLLLLVLSGGISIVWGADLFSASPGWRMEDFKTVYWGTRCLLAHHDPYSQSELEGFYRSEGQAIPTAFLHHQSSMLYINTPTSFLCIAPVAMLPLRAARLLWLALGGGGLTLAGFLMWEVGARDAPGLSLFLICMLLANSEIVFRTGNSAAIVVGFCIIATWCFLEGSFVPAGIACMAVSLLIKPHLAGPVWLYFLLAGGIYRKRALQTLVLTVLLALPTVVWVSQVAPHWIAELHFNLVTTSVNGGINDPGPALIHLHNIDMVIDLQSVISVFKDDPRFYNPASYLVCGALLIVWSVQTLRLNFSRRTAWLAIAAVVPLTMLVTYHRPWDAKLLLLTVPACAMLWAAGGAIGWIGFLLTTVAIVMIGDIPLIVLVGLTKKLPIPTAGLAGKIQVVLLDRPIPLILLAMSIFYLWVYLRRAGTDERSGAEA